MDGLMKITLEHCPGDVDGEKEEGITLSWKKR